ncbi:MULTISPECIES: RidA family protein [Acetobacter]|uniref:Enamine deaminase RidA (YjgF/YER057c/UK114 family) n=1 Tax=Acetobacter lovaniensis TaxID=104100 RepID=A0A841QI73_9PROT|nr:RidA family protein [Acetobacter lovaniensis]MBB6458280.1 enamine deaminase RidA (YjgF/YER057c/UK114 family) [Acetobacter lovaniensis]MCP1240503.1 RidA family protein [Acetobacter lovaniensis]NHN82516.1 hypothetical protein [Acetobacter lovaniensis]
MPMFKVFVSSCLFAIMPFVVTGSIAPAQAQSGIVRHNEAAYPIASAIEVPAGYSTVYVSGIGAPITNPAAPAKSVEAYGSMATQTEESLKRIKDILRDMGVGMGDVVQMHVFMIADAQTKKMDFEGMMQGYTKFFGTRDQPNLPVRSAFGVAQLSRPGWLVEIEVVAAKPPHH